MTPQFVLIVGATLISEDLTCIATGVLVAQHRLGLVEGTLACSAGIFVGDLLLFLAGRVAGSRNALGRWIPEATLAEAAVWMERRGLKVVLLSRFTPGLRLPTYVAAGLLRSRFWAFAGNFLLASVLWTPLVVAGTATFGEQALRSGLSRGPWAMPMVALTTFVILRLRDFETRRRLVGFVKRKLQWEFWPTWAAYAPLAPYLLYLAAKYRTLTLFTAANPGMFSGGLKGESKSEILGHLRRLPGAIAEFTLIPAGGAASVNEFPVVLKPDVGERGTGVTIAHSQQEVDAYLTSAIGDTILQRYVPGCEFGIYYSRGQVLYVTEKQFPHVIGDGQRSLKDLIWRGERAVCMAAAYFRVAKRPLESVPRAGERVQLVEIGSHCRGTVFLDGSHLVTPALTEAVVRISKAHPGFHIGRYDVRADSAEALRRGEFKVIELNGVGAEATHVYDPKVSIWETYRVMASHWRTAFELGEWNRAQGARPMSVGELWGLISRTSNPTSGLRRGASREPRTSRQTQPARG